MFRKIARAHATLQFGCVCDDPPVKVVITLSAPLHRHTKGTVSQWTSTAGITMQPGSDWAALSVELLSEVFTLLSLKTKIFCEGVCKTWPSTLRDEPGQGLWGNLVSLQNLPRQLTIVEMGEYNMVIGLPHWFKHTATLAGWLVQRHKGMKRVALGCPQEPIPEDSGTFSATHQVLSFMAAEVFGESFELVIFEVACYQLLVKHCGVLTLAASPVALTSAHLQALCNLTNLQVLEFDARSPIRQLGADIFLDLPQDLTRLTKLQKLTALSFPALPSEFSLLRHLCELHLAPFGIARPGLIPHDFSTHTLLTKLHIGTGYRLMPLALPMGPRVLLKSLILHTDCQLQYLEDCKKLKNLEVVPRLGQRMLRDGALPTALPRLTQLVVDDPADSSGEQEVWGRLPDQWQHYTALRKLSIPNLSLEVLPEWMTTLNKLRILEMQGVLINGPPYCPLVLRHMPKLQILNMDCIDTFIGEDILHLAQIQNLLLLVLGAIGEDLYDGNPFSPLDEEILCFQRLAVALEVHPNKLVQTGLSASSNGIWTFKASKGSFKRKYVDPMVIEYMRKVPDN